MKRALVGLCLVLLSSFAWALPSKQQIQDEIKAGRYSQAESMMSDVVAAKPGSADAHYVYAELLAHNGNFNKAADETAKARQIDPALSFTDPAKFRTFEATLQREQNAPVRSRAAPTTYQAPSTASMSEGRGMPGWVWIVGLAIVAMVLWRGFARSRASSVGAMAPAGFNGGFGPGQAAPGYGPGYGPGGAPMGGSGGSGLLGTGLAVAGGVAGGMLLDRALHNNNNEGGVGNAGFTGGGDNYTGNPAAQELQDRQIDFGNGNDWDSGGGGGGGVDLGGGGDSGGGGWD